MRTETSRKTQRVLQVVAAAFGKVYAGQFRIRFPVIGYGRDYAGVEGADGYHVLQRRAHGVAGEALYVADHHLVGAGAESFFQRLNFGRGAAAAGRGIGLVRHEHRMRRHLLFLKAVNILRLGYEFFHHGGHMVGIKAGDVEGGVRAFGQQQARERLHSAAAGEGFVFYDHGHRGGSDYQPVAAAVKRQGGFRNVFRGGGRA